MLYQWTHLYCLLVCYHSTMINSIIWWRELQVLLRQPYSKYKESVVCILFSTLTTCSRFSLFHVLRWTTSENWFVSRKWTKLSRWIQVAAAVFATYQYGSTEDMQNTWMTLELNRNGINNDQRSSLTRLSENSLVIVCSAAQYITRLASISGLFFACVCERFIVGKCIDLSLVSVAEKKKSDSWVN